MISCPPESDLLLLVDGELSDERADDVVTHLAECAECRVLLGNAEAALRFATGGLADTGRWTDASRAPQARALRPWRVFAAAAALVAAVTAAVLSMRDDATPVGVETASPAAVEHAPASRLDALATRAARLQERLSEPALSGRELLATGALAAAETRALTSGEPARRARLRDVMERFDGTAAAREARAVLAALGDVR